MEYKCYLGTYIGNTIVCSENIIEARAYKGKQKEWHNRYGYFLVKYQEGFDWGIITEYVECEIPE